MKHIGLCVAGMLAAIIVHSQDIQNLPADPAITCAVLPNGMSCYVAASPDLKGIADFALVMKAGATTFPDMDRKQVVMMAQETLASQYRLTAPSVQEYFMRLGVVPGKSGFAEVTDDATIFRFENVMLNQSATVMDSTLLVLMGMAERRACSDVPVSRRWFSPSDQAIVVAGDVDAAQVVQKLKMLSLMIPVTEPFLRPGYEWHDRDSLEIRISDGISDRLFMVSACWRLQRTPKEYMNTVQPAVYERYMSEAGIIACRRIRKALDEKGIPYADVSYGYVGSSRSAGDGQFRLNVAVASEHASDAVDVLASVVAALDGEDVGREELGRASLIYLDDLRAGLERDRQEGLEKCISAFLYNTALVSDKAVLAFHTSRDIDEDADLAIFNSIFPASVDPRRNLLLECRSGDMTVTEDMVRETFASSWENARNVQAEKPRAVPVLHGPGEQIKVKSVRKEYMSGGSVWTMANGFKVIVRNMPSDGVVRYSLALNGGYASVEGLKAGEGAYMSEILDFSTIGGSDPQMFYDVLRKQGMTMELMAGLSSLRINGRVPKDALDLLLSALQTVLYDRKTDMEAFGRRLGSEPLRLEHAGSGAEGRIGAIEDIMYPDYLYSSGKKPGALTEGFAARADAFMDSHASRTDEGMLILVGDVDEKRLKSALQAYAGGFRTSGRAFVRPVVNYQPISGKLLYTLEGGHESVDMSLSVPMSLTADNYYIAAVSSMILRKKLARAVAGTGMWLNLDYNCRKYPQERLNVMISLEEASVEGFAPGTASEDPIEALNAVRHVLDNPEDMYISDAELASCKALLKKYMERQKKDPEYWLKAVVIRYLDGKDFTTGCEDRIDSVTGDQVRKLLGTLSGGTRVEYIISKK